MTRQAQPSVIDPRPDIAAPNHGPNYALSGRGQCKSANTLAIMRPSQARLLAFDRAKRSIAVLHPHKPTLLPMNQGRTSLSPLRHATVEIGSVIEM